MFYRNLLLMISSILISSVTLADKKGPGSCQHSFISERPDCSFDFSLQYHILLKELFIFFARTHALMLTCRNIYCNHPLPTADGF